MRETATLFGLIRDDRLRPSDAEARYRTRQYSERY
jgi:hypothetical protein